MHCSNTNARLSGQPDDPRRDLAPTVSVADVLWFAPVNGAHGLGLDTQIGSLTPSKQADIVLLRTDRPNAVPNVDPVATVVTQMDVSNVDSVFVRGRVRHVERHAARRRHARSRVPRR